MLDFPILASHFGKRRASGVMRGSPQLHCAWDPGPFALGHRIRGGQVPDLLLVNERESVVVAFSHTDVDCGHGGQRGLPAVPRSDERRNPRRSLCGEEVLTRTRSIVAFR